MNLHDLKVWPIFWEAIADGRKTFECRINDRDFQSGDMVCFRLFDPEKSEYDGSYVSGNITYLLRGPQFGVADGWCVFSFSTNAVYYAP